MTPLPPRARTARPSHPSRLHLLAGMALSTLLGCASAPDRGDSPAQAAASAPDAPALPNAAAALPSEVQGQLSIKLEATTEQPASGLSLGFFFTGNAQRGQLDLMTLMGSQVAQVHWTPEQAWLLQNGQRRDYANLETLTQATLGQALPLLALMHWVSGHPDPQQPASATPEGFTQLGWQVDTRQLSQRRLQAHRDGSGAQRGAHIKVYLDR